MMPGASGQRGFVEAVRRANAPAPPEHSVLFRVATLVSVLVGVLACAKVGEISSVTAIAASAAVAAGMLFSYATRQRPRGIVKLLLAAAVVGVFVSFVMQVFSAARTGELSSIEVPLAGLFTWVQAIHSFDVPARRDLLFSLAAAAALVTVAGAQAVASSFLVFVAVWFVATLIALACSWRSMAGGRGRLPALGLVGLSALIIVVAVLLEAVLPPPRASQTITLPNSVTSYLPLPPGGELTQGGQRPNEPARAGSPAGPVRIGGFLGFAGPLDTGIRAALSNQVVMRVRADRPGYFLGMTYDHWDGQSWTERAPGCRQRTISTGSPFSVSYGAVGGTENIQTFYVAQNLPNLLFGTSVPDTVYFPDHSLILGCDNSIRSAIAMTPGTVYTVISQDTEEPLARLLRDHDSPLLAPPSIKAAYLQLPHPYPRVRALAESIVSRERATSSIAAEIRALEGWIGRHTRYSTDIPPLKPGQDAVDEFLFGNRTGYCEQISTALTVMLRTLGIPAREAIGYVPGPFDPFSDMYEIRASDAHAWVQAYIPQAGWQSFDPTAEVPLAPADPGAVLLSDIGSRLAHLPWAPIGGVVGAAAVGLGANAASRRRRLRPARWEQRAALRLERLGRRSGVVRRPAETLAEYTDRLAGSLLVGAGAGAEESDLVQRIGKRIAASAYGPPANHEAEAAVLEDLRLLARRIRRHH
ncbi:MAG: transglutaminaseTgpA domain-containing protein [Actinomycetota bacterium]|nr:transglutaminaseTgpA domain-containing protein [Actinomycetota bacterium]